MAVSVLAATEETASKKKQRARNFFFFFVMHIYDKANMFIVLYYQDVPVMKECDGRLFQTHTSEPLKIHVQGVGRSKSDMQISSC